MSQPKVLHLQAKMPQKFNYYILHPCLSKCIRIYREKIVQIVKSISCKIIFVNTCIFFQMKHTEYAKRHWEVCIPHRTSPGILIKGYK